jgi:PAS domain S-box-containing protein
MTARKASDPGRQPEPTFDLLEIARKKAESEALFLSIGEGAIVTDERGRISRVNQTALDILGYKEEDLVGKWFPSAILSLNEDGEVIPTIERPIAQVFLTGKPLATRTYYRRKDGSPIVVYLTVSPVIMEGKPIGAIEVFRDVTEEVELERAKDEFISLASHQLRTPASAVKQYAGMLLQGYAGDMTEQQLRMVETIYECNERQITIVNDLLRVAQVDAGKVKLRPIKTDIATIVHEIIQDLASKFETRGQQVEYAPDEPEITAVIDPQLMRMVIENIIDNASKYTPEGKRIVVRVRRRSRHVIVAIEDQGVGIEVQNIQQIFQKFSRVPNSLSNKVGGTGLGLYWAKKIVDLHGGRIKVTSTPDEGSTFAVHIPAHTVGTDTSTDLTSGLIPDPTTDPAAL